MEVKVPGNTPILLYTESRRNPSNHSSVLTVNSVNRCKYSRLKTQECKNVKRPTSPVKTVHIYSNLMLPLIYCVIFAKIISILSSLILYCIQIRTIL